MTYPSVECFVPAASDWTKFQSCLFSSFSNHNQLFSLHFIDLAPANFYTLALPPDPLVEGISEPFLEEGLGHPSLDSQDGLLVHPDPAHGSLGHCKQEIVCWTRSGSSKGVAQPHCTRWKSKIWQCWPWPSGQHRQAWWCWCWCSCCCFSGNRDGFHQIASRNQSSRKFLLT